MTMKKMIYVSPAVTVVEIQMQQLMAVSGKVDGDPGLTPDPTPANPSVGLSRRHNDIWADEEELDEEYF